MCADLVAFHWSQRKTAFIRHVNRQFVPTQRKSNTTHHNRLFGRQSVAEATPKGTFWYLFSWNNLPGFIALVAPYFHIVHHADDKSFLLWARGAAAKGPVRWTSFFDSFITCDEESPQIRDMLIIMLLAMQKARQTPLSIRLWRVCCTGFVLN